MDNDSHKLYERDEGKTHHDTSSTMSEQPVSSGIPSIEFLSQDKNSSFNANTAEFYDSVMEECKTLAQELVAAEEASAESENKKEIRAKRYLVKIAETVLSADFNLESFSNHIGHKVSKSDRKNPFSLVMRHVEPNRSTGAISRLSQVLIFALVECYGDPSNLTDFFSKHSINDCRQKKTDKARALKKVEDTDTQQALLSDDGAVLLYGLPKDCEGELIVRLNVHKGTANVLELLE